MREWRSRTRRPNLPDALERRLVAGQPVTFIDVGAHEGEFTRAVEDFSGVAHAILIEPQPKRASELQRQFADSRFEVLQTAVADKTGFIDLEINEFDATTSILPTHRGIPEVEGIDVAVREVVRCRLTTLDVVASRVGNIDLIKMDVQGAEHLVIKGAEETLRRTRLVWCEVSFRPLYEGSATFPDIYALLRERGFLFVAIEPGFRSPCGELLQADVLFAR